MVESPTGEAPKGVLPFLLEPHFVRFKSSALGAQARHRMWRTKSSFPEDRCWYVIITQSKRFTDKYYFGSAKNVTHGRVDYKSRWMTGAELEATWARCLLENRCVWEPDNEGE